MNEITTTEAEHQAHCPECGSHESEKCGHGSLSRRPIMRDGSPAAINTEDLVYVAIERGFPEETMRELIEKAIDHVRAARHNEDRDGYLATRFMVFVEVIADFTGLTKDTVRRVLVRQGS